MSYLITFIGLCISIFLLNQLFKWKEKNLRLKFRIHGSELTLFKDAPFTKSDTFKADEISSIHLVTTQGFASHTVIKLNKGREFTILTRWRKDHRKLIEFARENNISCETEEEWFGGEVEKVK